MERATFLLTPVQKINNSHWDMRSRYLYTKKTQCEEHGGKDKWVYKNKVKLLRCLTYNTIQYARALPLTWHSWVKATWSLARWWDMGICLKSQNRTKTLLLCSTEYRRNLGIGKIASFQRHLFKERYHWTNDSIVNSIRDWSIDICKSRVGKGRKRSHSYMSGKTHCHNKATTSRDKG